ncbi:unnamed protein product [Prunus armeniaca]
METGVEPATFNHRLLRSCILSISLLPANMVHQLQGTSLCSYVYSTSSHYSGIVLGNLFRRMTSLWQLDRSVSHYCGPLLCAVGKEGKTLLLLKRQRMETGYLKTLKCWRMIFQS